MEESNKHNNEPTQEEINELVRNAPSVENMTSSRGNTIPNQFIIYGGDWTLFQSYSSPIAMRKGGRVYIFPKWNYSVTTGKYRNEFLRETKKETEAKLKSGEYIKVGF
jgi:hypothetical protein